MPKGKKGKKKKIDKVDVENPETYPPLINKTMKGYTVPILKEMLTKLKESFGPKAKKMN